jgi:hypothetical protein
MSVPLSGNYGNTFVLTALPVGAIEFVLFHSTSGGTTYYYIMKRDTSTAAETES